MTGRQRKKTARSTRLGAGVLLGALGVAVWAAWGAIAAPGPGTPAITATPSAALTNTTSRAFTYVASGAVSYQCSLDGAAFAACPNGGSSYFALASGSHDFRVKGVDGKGNTGGTATHSWTVDAAAPGVASIALDAADPTAAATVTWKVTFSESVTGVAAGSFALVQGGGVGGAGSLAVSGGGSDYTVTASTGTGNGTLGLTLAAAGPIADAAGNALAGLPFAGPAFTIDRTPPAVVSILRAGASPTREPNVGWIVTFAKPVTGVGTTDFALVRTGGTGSVAVGSVAGSDSVYTVTATTGGGEGTLRLDLVDDDSIADASGLRLGGAGSGNGDHAGEEYEIDKVAPSKPYFTLAPPDPSSSATSRFDWMPHLPSADIVRYDCRKENGPWTPCSPPVDYALETTNNGMHQLEVRAVDDAGNTSQSLKHEWKVAKGSGQEFTIRAARPG